MADGDANLIDEVGDALDSGQPLELLMLVSMLLLAAEPQLLHRPGDDAPLDLDDIVTAFIGSPGRETTALLATLGELLPGNETLRARCRQEVAGRRDRLPRWLARLSETAVRRAVLMTHVLGDADEVLLDVRLADRTELTCAVYIDHLSTSAVKDAFLVPAPIEAVLGLARSSDRAPDTTLVDLPLDEAAGRVSRALAQMMSSVPFGESDTWPSSRALVTWLLRTMPDAGPESIVPQRNSVDSAEFLGQFFASAPGSEFDTPDHRELMQSSVDAGTGDPLRWSDARLLELLGETAVEGPDVPVEVLLDLPELLRRFVPFAHAESGIRAVLTTEALAAIDSAADGYRTAVLEQR